MGKSYEPSNDKYKKPPVAAPTNKSEAQMDYSSSKDYRYDLETSKAERYADPIFNRAASKQTSKPTGDARKVKFYLDIQYEVFEFMLLTVQEGINQFGLIKEAPTYDTVIDSINCVVLCLLYNQAHMLTYYLSNSGKDYMPELPDSISIYDYQSFLMNETEVKFHRDKLQRYVDRSEERLAYQQKFLDPRDAQGKELMGVISNVKSKQYWEK